MQILAQQDGTWATPGLTSPVGFLAAVALVVAGTLAHRALFFAGRPVAAPERLGPEQIAYLNGGDRLAVYTTLGALRGLGAIGMAPDRCLVPTGPLPSNATPLAQAVYNAAGRRVSPRALPGDQWVGMALGDLRTALERDGLVLTRSARRAGWIGPGLLLVLLVPGLPRMLGWIGDTEPVPAPALVTAVLLCICWRLAATVPRRTRAATAALRTLRKRHLHLAPRQAPAYATYGVAGAATGIALFGPASLWALDPGFAAEAGVPQSMPDAGGTSGDAGGCGGSSCGGGGGSSCGGGGGSSG